MSFYEKRKKTPDVFRYPAGVRFVAPRWKRALVPGLLALVLAYATLVRLDRLVLAYGPFDHPCWLVTLERSVTALRPLVPPGWTWEKVNQPYVGGDPINYLKYAREMRHFYQGHVREPVFLATTRVFLWMTGDQDVAVSFASLAFSVLCVLATYLLGSALGSRWIGLLAAAALAIEHEVITWAPDGWRDEAFTLFVVLSAWAFVRLQRSWTWPAAVVAGVLAAAACLTRLSSLTFLLPALLWLAWPWDRSVWRAHIARVGLAAAVMTVLVAPYLVNTYRESGDPFYAVNYHTTFYQYAQGMVTETAPDRPRVDRRRVSPHTDYRGGHRGPRARRESVRNEVARLQQHGAAPRAGVAVAGGRRAHSLADTAGRAAAARRPLHVARALHADLVDSRRRSLALYLARVSVLSRRGVSVRVRHRRRRLRVAQRRRHGDHRAHQRPAHRPAVAAGAIVLSLALLEDYWIPYLVAKESLETGASTSVMAGPDDGVFFTDGWSDLVQGGAVIARLATKQVATIYVPLPERRGYRLIIRMDPVVPDATPPQHVRVYLGGHAVGVFTLDWNPERVGAYITDIPAGLVQPGRTQLDLMADDLLPLERAGKAFPELSRDVRAAFRLWYVRVVPL